MKLSRFDLMDRFSAYSFEYVDTETNKTFDVIAVDDIIQALDEFMDDDDIIKIINSKKHLKEQILELDAVLKQKNEELKKMKKLYAKI